MLTVTTPANDPWLLTIEQARAAAGVTDSSKDAQLEPLRQAVSALIYDACNIAVGNGAPPTIRKERLTEIIPARAGQSIILSRRHEVNVISVENWSVGIDPSLYYVEAEAGLIRPVNPRPCSGAGIEQVTVVYDAGFATVPPVLLTAASEMIRVGWSELARDPLVKKTVIDVDGVDRVETEFWVTKAGNTAQTDAVPPTLMATLKRFRNSAYA